MSLLRPFLRFLAPAAVIGVLAAAFVAPRSQAVMEGGVEHRSTVDPGAGIDNLDHLIFIVQENRSFDHYFGTFPGADGIPRYRERAVQDVRPRSRWPVPAAVPRHEPVRCRSVPTARSARRSRSTAGR